MIVQRFRQAAPLFALSLLLAACGSGEESGIENETGAGGGLPASVDTGVVDGSVTVDTQGVTGVADTAMSAVADTGAHAGH